MATKKVEKTIPRKNYVIAGIVIVAIILGSLYLYKWYDVWQENRISESYLMQSKTIVYEIKELSEIESVFSETPNEYFVYISYTKDKEVYELEKELRPIIEEYKLKDYFYYININEIMQEANYLDKLNAALELDEVKVETVPTILFFQDGELKPSGIIKREDNLMMEAADFSQLLDVNAISKEHK